MRLATKNWPNRFSRLTFIGYRQRDKPNTVFVFLDLTLKIKDDLYVLSKVLKKLTAMPEDGSCLLRMSFPRISVFILKITTRVIISCLRAGFKLYLLILLKFCPGISLTILLTVSWSVLVSRTIRTMRTIMFCISTV